MLLSQRKKFRSSADKLFNVINRVPVVNSLTRSIRNKKNRDKSTQETDLTCSLIVACVIAVCICFCIWYVFHK